MASVKVKFKTDKVLSDGTHPVVLQVIHNRKRKVFYLGYSATKDQWDDEKNKPKSNHPDHQLIKTKIKNTIHQLKIVVMR